jgi:RNA polymerase sigma-70 factor, ECF subfamily
LTGVVAGVISHPSTSGKTDVTQWQSAPQAGQAVAPPSLDETLQRAVRQARRGIEMEESVRLIDGSLRPRLLNYFRAYPLCREDAEDLVQKTLARVFRSIGGLENEESFLPWLFAIARNVRRTAQENRLREGSSVELTEEMPDPDSSSRIEQEVQGRERREALSRAIERLPARQRQCLALRVRDGLSYEEIAATLRLSAHTVRNHLAAARKSLKKLVRDGREEARRG